MLEDESGRVVLVGERLRAAGLVTGVIVGALGIETSGGEFEVVDVCFAGMAPQPSAGLPWGPDARKEEQMDVDVDADGERVRIAVCVNYADSNA